MLREDDEHAFLLVTTPTYSSINVARPSVIPHVSDVDATLVSGRCHITDRSVCGLSSPTAMSSGEVRREGGDIAMAMPVCVQGTSMLCWNRDVTFADVTATE